MERVIFQQQLSSLSFVLYCGSISQVQVMCVACSVKLWISVWHLPSVIMPEREKVCKRRDCNEAANGKREKMDIFISCLCLPCQRKYEFFRGTHLSFCQSLRPWRDWVFKTNPTSGNLYHCVAPTPAPPPSHVPSHLSDGAQQLPIGEDDDYEGHDEAEDKQADDVGYAVGSLGRPFDRAGGARTLQAIAAPAEEGRQGPDQGVDPGQYDAQWGLTVVRSVSLGRGHHGAVALIGEDGQGDQRHDAWGVERTNTYYTQ